MTVTFRDKPVDDLAGFLKSKAPAHEKLGAFYLYAKTHDVAPLLPHLGIDPKDEAAIHELSALVQKIARVPIMIKPDPLNSGIYHLYDKEKPIAVFKIGRKRANDEIAMRNLSFQLGLEKYMAPCMYLAVSSLAFMQSLGDEEDTVETLFSGFQKEFLRYPNRAKDAALLTACAVVGVVQPFLHDDPQNQNDLLSYTKTVLFAAAAGMRDVKADGVIDHRIVDGEDAMPERFMLEFEDWDRSVPHTHLPYLNHDNAFKILPPEMIAEMQGIVRHWNIPEIIDKLSRLPILFPDKLEAKTKPGADIDEGNYPVLVTTALPHPVDGERGFDITNQSTLFTKRQLEACSRRLEALQKYILESKSFRPIDVVFAQDVFYHMHYLTLAEMKRTSSGNAPRSAAGDDALSSLAYLDLATSKQADRLWTGYDRSAVLSQLGAVTPKSSFSPISPHLMAARRSSMEPVELLAARRSSMDPLELKLDGQSDEPRTFTANHKIDVAKPTASRTIT